MGTLGLCVFLFVFFVYPFKLFLKHRQELAISVLVCLAICFLTENMLDRYQGEILIAFILPLVSKIKDDKKVLATDFLKGTC